MSSVVTDSKFVQELVTALEHRFGRLPNIARLEAIAARLDPRQITLANETAQPGPEGGTGGASVIEIVPTISAECPRCHQRFLVEDRKQ